MTRGLISTKLRPRLQGITRRRLRLRPALKKTVTRGDRIRGRIQHPAQAVVELVQVDPDTKTLHNQAAILVAVDQKRG